MSDDGMDALVIAYCFCLVVTFIGLAFISDF